MGCGFVTLQIAKINFSSENKNKNVPPHFPIFAVVDFCDCVGMHMEKLMLIVAFRCMITIFFLKRNILFGTSFVNLKVSCIIDVSTQL